MGLFKEFIHEQSKSIHDHDVSNRFIMELQGELKRIASSDNLTEAKNTSFKIDKSLGRLVATKTRALITNQKTLLRMIKLSTTSDSKKTELLAKMQLLQSKLALFDLGVLLGDRTLINV